MKVQKDLGSSSNILKPEGWSRDPSSTDAKLNMWKSIRCICIYIYICRSFRDGRHVASVALAKPLAPASERYSMECLHEDGNVGDSKENRDSFEDLGLCSVQKWRSMYVVAWKQQRSKRSMHVICVASLSGLFATCIAIRRSTLSVSCCWKKVSLFFPGQAAENGC